MDLSFNYCDIIQRSKFVYVYGIMRLGVQQFSREEQDVVNKHLISLRLNSGSQRAE